MHRDNERADELAGRAARDARVPQADRVLVGRHEQRAGVVRRRLLRATMNSGLPGGRPASEEGDQKKATPRSARPS
eukprot:3045826-Pyramimonas_sp.AAC.1